MNSINQSVSNHLAYTSYRGTPVSKSRRFMTQSVMYIE